MEITDDPPYIRVSNFLYITNTSYISKFVYSVKSVDMLEFISISKLVGRVGFVHILLSANYAYFVRYINSVKD